MTSTVVKENALTEDILHVADDGKIFKGGYKALLEYYTYANEWGDKAHIRGFRTLETAGKYIAKHYPNAEAI